jgi:DNA-binding MarR family transcriptional regulator
MDSKKELEQKVFLASRDNGISSVLFRNATARRLGLNGTDSDCLSFLSIKGTATPTEIARYTGLTTGSTTAMLDRLEQAKFIARRPNPNDRRGIIIEISDKYRETVWPLVAGVQKAQSKLIASYTAEELITIADFLNRFSGNVKESTGQIENSGKE